MQFVMNIFTNGEFLPNYEIVKLFAKEACTADMEALNLCGNIIFLICGFDPDNLNVVSGSLYSGSVDAALKCHFLCLHSLVCLSITRTLLPEPLSRTPSTSHRFVGQHVSASLQLVMQ